MKEGREVVGGAYSSEDDRDNITLSERRNSALTKVFRNKIRVRPSRTDPNFPNLLVKA